MTPDEVMRFLDAGFCPICSAGPFRVVANHTTRSHDVDRFQLRAMAGKTKHARGVGVDPSLSADLVERGQSEAEQRKQYLIYTGGKKHYGEIGALVQSAKGRRVAPLMAPAGAVAVKAKWDRYRDANPVICVTCGATVAREKRRRVKTCSEDCRRIAIGKTRRALKQKEAK